VQLASWVACHDPSLAAPARHEARLGTIIPAIGQLADGIAAASAHDRQRIQYRKGGESR
jgi:hypothetical protein